MNNTKEKLKKKQLALGTWLMIGNPAVAEIMAGEGFDFISVDMEHTPSTWNVFTNLCWQRKVQDVICWHVYLHVISSWQSRCWTWALRESSCLGKFTGRGGPVCRHRQFPPEGVRGASLCRASGFGSNFADYYERHNKEVIVVVMLEHINAARQADAILATPGIDAALIGPYDLSASMGLVGQLYHPDVLAAQQMILDACRRQNVVAGIHLVKADPESVRQRIDQGFRFIAVGSIPSSFAKVPAGIEAKLGS